MNRLRSEKGVTLLEALISVLMISIASTVFLTFILHHSFQKENQKETINLTNIAIKSTEETTNQLRTEPIVVPYLVTKEETHRNKDYTITTKISEETIGNPGYQKGRLLNVQTTVTNGKKTGEITTYVYQE